MHYVRQQYSFGSRQVWFEMERMSDAMRTFHVLPANILAPHIDRLWGLESVGNERIALPILLPGTGAELYFHYSTPFRRSAGSGDSVVCHDAHLFCIRSRPIELLPARDIGFVAVRFRAGMMHRFIDIPGGELIDRDLSAEDLWGATGQTLATRAASAETLTERLRLIQCFLVERFARRSPDMVFEHAATLLYENCIDLTIDHLAERVGLGRRQLERRFNAIAGQTPVELRGLARFQKTVRTLILDNGAQTTDAALAHGYYDQAHFIRHFRRLAAESPERHLKAARTRTHFYNTPWRACTKIAAPLYP